jgi:hypothetical protein
MSTMRLIHDTTDKWRADVPRFNSNALTRGVNIYNWLYHLGSNSGARIGLGRLGAAAVRTGSRLGRLLPNVPKG